MIKKQSEIPGRVVSRLKEGVGDLSFYDFLTEAEAKGAGRLFAKTVIQPGDSIGLHTHIGDMEAYYILKGKGLLNDNGTEVVLEAGDCNVCFDGNSHAIRNIGDEALEFVAIVLYSKQKEV